ncbi:MAG TPA: hypothetical protein VGD39_09680 [Nocardioides sp.]
MITRPCPAWCVHCVAVNDLPTSAGEVHRSAPVPLVMPSAWGDEVNFFVQLRQQISVHDTDPVLAIWSPGDYRPVLLPLHTVRLALGAIVRLVGQADRDIALEVAEAHAAMRAQALTAVRRGGRDG